MKNIHILPTSQPSRLAYDFDKLILNSRLLSPILYKTQNIYITSDEEIKVGDWFISLYSNSIQKELKLDCTLNKDAYKKIILTTDQDLDGVQAIDDEFLEWFVKNPSCEYVEVEEFEPIYGHQNNSSNVLYKIIIPKEEPKQTDEKGRPMTYWGGLEEPKQETLEEVAERLKGKELFKESNDRARKTLSEIKSLPIQERSYSEEEVLEIIRQYALEEHLITSSKPDIWFEQFKKK